MHAVCEALDYVICNRCETDVDIAELSTASRVLRSILQNRMETP